MYNLSVDDLNQWVSNIAEASPQKANSDWNAVPDLNHGLDEEMDSIFVTNQFRPTSPSYLYLIPACLDLFTEHIYLIMPLIYMPTLRACISRPLEMYEKNLLYSLCAVTSTHMSGKSIQAPGPPSWEVAGRSFLDECILTRQSYDFVEDRSLYAVISSYFVSIAFFELNQNRKSWYYLREAMTLAQDLGLHDENTYAGLDPSEELCRRRTFWILFVTERYVLCKWYITSRRLRCGPGHMLYFVINLSLFLKCQPCHLRFMIMSLLKSTRGSCA